MHRSAQAGHLCRQESYFHYLFGVEDEDYYGALDLRNGRTMLFMPRLPEAYAVSTLQSSMQLSNTTFGQFYITSILHRP